MKLSELKIGAKTKVTAAAMPGKDLLDLINSFTKEFTSLRKEIYKVDTKAADSLWTLIGKMTKPMQEAARIAKEFNMVHSPAKGIK